MDNILTKMASVASQLDSQGYCYEADIVASIMTKIAQSGVDWTGMTGQTPVSDRYKMTPPSIPSAFDPVTKLPIAYRVWKGLPANPNEEINPKGGLQPLGTALLNSAREYYATLPQASTQAPRGSETNPYWEYDTTTGAPSLRNTQLNKNKQTMIRLYGPQIAAQVVGNTPLQTPSPQTAKPAASIPSSKTPNWWETNFRQKAKDYRAYQNTNFNPNDPNTAKSIAAYMNMFNELRRKKYTVSQSRQWVINHAKQSRQSIQYIAYLDQKLPKQ